MLRKTVLTLSLAWFLLVLRGAAASEQLPPANQWVPEDAVIVVELAQPKVVLDLVFDPEVIAAVTSAPAYQAATAQPGFQQFLILLEFLEFRCGTDWRTGVRKLLGGGVTLALGPGETSVVVIDSEDAQLLKQVHDVILTMTHGGATPESSASTQYGDVTAWSFNGQEEHAIVDNCFVLANGLGALEAALARRMQPRAQRGPSDARRAAMEAADDDAAATAYVDLATLKQGPGVRQALTQMGNPMAALLLAGIQEAANAATWSALGLGVEDHTLTLKATVDGEAGKLAAFARPDRPDGGPLPNLSVPRRIAALSLYRDPHAFYAAKDDLFPERTSGLIFFENMMGIFFTGRDLTDEVMGQLRPEIRVVVAEQEYDPAVGTPRAKIPAFAVVMLMKEPERFSQVVEEAWQKALGLANFTRGQQALPGLIIDRLTHGDVKFSVAYFAPPAGDDRTNVPSRYNYRPTLVMFDDYLILSSAAGLARDLIDALKEEIANGAAPLRHMHSLLDIDITQLSSVLNANREGLVRQNMIKDGSTLEEAEAQVDLIVMVLGYLGHATVDAGSGGGQSWVRLALKLNLPGAK